MTEKIESIWATLPVAAKAVVTAIGVAGSVFLGGAASARAVDVHRDLPARVTALEVRLDMVVGLARMECMDDAQRATLAGLPCRNLLDGDE